MASAMMLALGSCGEASEGCEDGTVLVGASCVPIDGEPDVVIPADTSEGDEGPIATDAPETHPPGTPVTLPFAVDDYFAPSGYMGDGETPGLIEDAEACSERAGEAEGLCHAFTYTPGAAGWAGVFWQYPENNWGAQEGLSVTPGATMVSFWAWAPSAGHQIDFLVGGIGDDTINLSESVTLSDTPTQYVIDLTSQTYDAVIAGFGWSSPAPTGGGALNFYVDDIQWEGGDNPCADAPCQNGGACAATSNGFTCDCSGTGYTGETCTEDVDECVESPCLNGGACANSEGSFTCDCADTGYEGETCGEDVDECAADPCLHDGVCENTDGSFDCDCAGTGYEGEICAEDTDECLEAPCLNGGLCSNTDGAFACDCTDTGYMGDLCEFPVPVAACVTEPCQNGALCIEIGDTDFECVCEGTGYQGTLCDQDIDECLGAPCQNGGACINAEGDFACDCAGTGYMGPLCADDVDECDSDGCANGGDCTNTVGGFTCDCEGTGYTGATCADDIDECLESPCQNGGVCANTDGGFTCDCAGTGYAGTLCEEVDVPGVAVPFWVDDHYIMSGLMGGGTTTDTPCDTNPGDPDGPCHGITWLPQGSDWAGWFYQHPENNWTDPGLAIKPGATHVSFTAWGAVGGERINVGAGIILSDGFNVETGFFTLSTTPTEYTLSLLDTGYYEVAGGFAWYTESPTGAPVSFFLDDVRWNVGSFTPNPEPPADCEAGLTPPFWVDACYIWSGYMGSSASLDLAACTVSAGDPNGACWKVSWVGATEWTGVYAQYPANNWSGPGLTVASGATKVTFSAWGEDGGEVVEFKAGINGADGWELDPAIFTLTDTPTTYSIDLPAYGDTVAGGFAFAIVHGDNAKTTVFYMDDIRWE